MADLVRVSLQEFRLRLHAYKANAPRSITGVHLHHTWRPRQRDWQGLPTMQAMRRYHMTDAGMRDIAQHLTIAPDGSLWLGRDLSWPPGSAKGHNGTSKQGPFMIEVVGDFDVGQERLDGDQLDAVARAIAVIAEAFGLSCEDHEVVATWLEPHTKFAAKSCPGTSLYDKRDGWKVLRDSDTLPALVCKELPTEALDGIAVAARESAANASQRSTWTSAEDVTVPEHDAEIGTRIAIDAERFASEARGMDVNRGSRGAAIELARHVVNSRLGELSSSGFRTTTDDLDRLFHTHLLGWVREQYAASREGRKRKPQIMLWAHGGLVGEVDALERVTRQAAFWLANGIYPIYFVWETGLFETLGQMMGGARGFTDTTDRLIERVARVGKPIWRAMKDSARRNSEAVLDNGSVGAAVLVKRHLDALFAELEAERMDDVGLHVVGHSAGSIFLCEMFGAGLLAGPGAMAHAGRPVQSVQFLAPALQRDRFRDELAPALGNTRLAMYTMDDERECDDQCGIVYRKSLLYLVRQALESQRKTPILGLERDILSDAALRTRFGITETSPGRLKQSVKHSNGDWHIFWSRAPRGSSYTNAMSHGDFDDDAKTLDSLVRFIHGFDVGRPESSVDKPYAVHDDASGGRASRTADGWPWLPVDAAPAASSTQLLASPHGPSRPVAASAGRRIAVCVGIDRYASRPLRGCVADAREWERYLTGQQGFTIMHRLHDDTATAKGIYHALAELVAEGRPGDVLCFVYAGHGTQFADGSKGTDLDEPDNYDEALVSIDADHEGYLVDDMIASTIAPVPDGCKLLMFMDCCHSGTNFRFAGPPVEESGMRARYLPPSQHALAITRSWVQASGLPRGDSRSVPAVLHFAACRDDEYAYEINDRGVFSTHMLAALAASGGASTPAVLMEDVRRRLGASARQSPRFHAGPWRDERLFDVRPSRGRGGAFDPTKLPFNRG